MKSSIDNSVNLGGQQTITGKKSYKKEVFFAAPISGTGAGQARIIAGEECYGVIFRADSQNFYIMLTNISDSTGTWNDYRPFAINANSGKLKINTDVMPNYTSSVALSWNSVVTMPFTGVVRIGANARDNAPAILRYNSSSGPILWEHGDYGGATFAATCIPVAKGTKLYASGGSSGQTFTAFPSQGIGG